MITIVLLLTAVFTGLMYFVFRNLHIEEKRLLENDVKMNSQYLTIHNEHYYSKPSRAIAFKIYPVPNRIDVLQELRTKSLPLKGYKIKSVRPQKVEQLTSVDLSLEYSMN